MQGPATLAAELLSSQTLPGDYTLLVLRVPQNTPDLQAGSYCRISNNDPPICAPIMTDNAGTLKCLYRNRLSVSLPGMPKLHGQLTVTVEGKGWNLHGNKSDIVFLAQNEGLACVVHAVGRLLIGNTHRTLTAFLEFDERPPFTPKPSQILLPGAPAEALACVPLLEDWGVASRLADPGNRPIPKPGWFSGTAVKLAETWLANTGAENRLLACCGSQRFVEAALSLADQWRLPVEATVLP